MALYNEEEDLYRKTYGIKTMRSFYAHGHAEEICQLELTGARRVRNKNIWFVVGIYFELTIYLDRRGILLYIVYQTSQE